MEYQPLKNIHYSEHSISPPLDETPKKNKYKLSDKQFTTPITSLGFNIADSATDTVMFGMHVHHCITKNIKPRRTSSTNKEDMVNAYAIAAIYGKVPRRLIKYPYSVYRTIKRQGIVSPDIWTQNYIRTLDEAHYDTLVENTKSKNFLGIMANYRFSKCMAPRVIDIMMTRQVKDIRKFLQLCARDIKDPFTGNIVDLLLEPDEEFDFSNYNKLLPTS